MPSAVTAQIKLVGDRSDRNTYEASALSKWHLKRTLNNEAGKPNNNDTNPTWSIRIAFLLGHQCTRRAIIPLKWPNPSTSGQCWPQSSWPYLVALSQYRLAPSVYPEEGQTKDHKRDENQANQNLIEPLWQKEENPVFFMAQVPSGRCMTKE